MSTALMVSTMPTGTDLVEKTKAFAEISSLVSSGFMPRGISTVQQVKAICWMADAVGAHPMVALQECYVVHGKVGFSWRFKLGLVLSRLPEFDWEEVESTDTKAVLRGRKDGKSKWVTVEYTIDQAKKQGLTSNPLYLSDPKDMLFKQAMHRLLDRTAGHVLRGMPVPELAGEEQPDAEPAAKRVAQPGPAPTPSEAEVLDDDEPAVIMPDKPTDYVAKLSELINQLWMPMGSGKRLQKASLVMSQIRGETITYKRARDISQADAQEMVEYLLAKYPGGKATPEVHKGEQEAGGDLEVADMEAAESTMDSPAMDESQAEQEPASVSFEEFIALVGKARRVLPKTADGNAPKVVQEAPTGSGKYFITYGKLLASCGFEPAPMKFYEGQQLTIEPNILTMLHDNLRELIREAEKPDYAKS